MSAAKIMILVFAPMVAVTLLLACMSYPVYLEGKVALGEMESVLSPRRMRNGMVSLFKENGCATIVSNRPPDKMDVYFDTRHVRGVITLTVTSVDKEKHAYTYLYRVHADESASRTAKKVEALSLAIAEFLRNAQTNALILTPAALPVF